MAIMIPTQPRMFDERSHEDFIFTSLKKLPSDYYVIHSFCSTDIIDNIFVEKEADFIIFNPKKGILVLEAKAGGVDISQDAWIYKASGKECPYDGPYRQAELAMRFIKKQVEARISGISSRCKFLYTACFPDMTQKKLKSISFRTQEQSFKDRTICKDELENEDKLLLMVENIFDIDVSKERPKTKLTDEDTRKIIKIFCDEVHVAADADLSHDLVGLRFFSLLSEQLKVLDFLKGQKTAAINGAAGTGKTIIACERAKKLVEEEGSKVLYLCYNNLLCEYLKTKYNNYKDNIDFYTISSYACKLANMKFSGAVYTRAKNLLATDSKLLAYDHIIIDEAQDFGIKAIEESGLINEMFYIILYERENGSFFSFYDKLQMIFNNQLPEFIQEADCKMTLFTNCRNTTFIATTSLIPIIDENNSRRLDCLDKSNTGKTPRFYFTPKESSEACLDSVLKDLHENRNLKPEEIVILTLGSEDKSLISHPNGKYKNRYSFYTAKRFKGLESKAVILVDVTVESFVRNSSQLDEKDILDFDLNNELTYYVGASRAREYLEVITSMTDEDCLKIFHENDNFKNMEAPVLLKKAKKAFVDALGANKKDFPIK